jgi:large repetitive protein
VKVDSSFLAKADTIQIAYMINIKRPISDTIYTQAVAKGVSTADSTKIFSDLSTNGINPDVNGNGKAEEESLTPIICKGAVQLSSIFIPQGFSPNGDNNNDTFKILGVKPTEQVELIIFNRYGGVVYASQDYKNDWNGTSNQGVKVIGDGQGLPDGTYFYCVTRSLRADGTKVDLKPIVKYITLMR